MITPWTCICTRTWVSRGDLRTLLMKRSLRIRLLVAGLALLAAGCGRREAPRIEAARRGILLWGNGTEVQGIDPQIVTGVPEHHVITALCEGLLAEDPHDLHPVPGVAESYTVSDDKRVYTFHLRSDARWSNGDPLTAQDFLRSYQRILTRSFAAEYANMIYDFVENAHEYFDGTITDFSKVGFSAPDEHTLVVRLKYPTPFFPKILASHYSWFPVPVKVIAKYGDITQRSNDWARPENFVGNGPFRIKDWRYKQVFKVERNPYYWDHEHVRLNEIWFYPTEDIPGEERRFRAGELHHTNEVPLTKIDVYRKENSPALHIEPFLGAYFYRFNVTRRPFDDVRVRRAFAISIDREALVKDVTRGGQAPAYRFTPAGFPGYHPTARLRPGTLAEARQLLVDAGYPGGQGMPEVELLYNTSASHKQIAEALQEMWRKNLGVTVRLRNEEWATYLDSQDHLNYSMSRSGWIADYVHPHTFLEIFVTNGGNNDTGWSNAEYDALRAKALASATDEERFAIYNRMEQILMDELPILPIYDYTRVYLQDPAVQGFYPTPLDNHPWKYIWIEPPAEPDAKP